MWTWIDSTLHCVALTLSDAEILGFSWKRYFTCVPWYTTSCNTTLFVSQCAFEQTVTGICIFHYGTKQGQQGLDAISVTSHRITWCERFYVWLSKMMNSVFSNLELVSCCAHINKSFDQQIKPLSNTDYTAEFVWMWEQTAYSEQTADHFHVMVQVLLLRRRTEVFVKSCIPQC